MLNAKYWTLLFFCFSITPLAAQCGLTVNAGPDLTICGLGNTGQLNGAVLGNYTSFQWIPAAGLSNPNSLTPTVSGPGIYTLTATGPSNVNLIANGDFESGAAGFSSDYTFNPIPILNGTYTTVTSPQLIVSTFPPCDDHTFGNGTGQMLLVNGDGTPGENVWCQTIPVDPNTNYDLSAWVSTLVPFGLAQLQFSVNGQLIGGSVSPTATPCEWVPFSATWNSGASTTATVCVITQSSSGFGNDFVLDDIEMYGECQVTDEVLVEVLPEPVVNVQAFRCLGDCFFIGNTPYCSTGSYSQAIPMGNGCDSTINLQLTVLEAIAIALPPDTLNCYNDFTVEIDASPSTVSPFTTYSWTGPNGFNSSLQNPIVSRPGTYTLEVTTSAGNIICSNTTSVSVVEQNNQPIADAGPDLVLGCGASLAILDGSASSVGAQVVYNWNGPDGFNDSTLTPTVDQAGIYILEALDTLSGCASLDSVSLSFSGDSLTLSLSADTLTCAQPNASLTAVPDSAAVQFEWSGPNGFQDSLLNTQVSEPGWYSFRQTDSTGCSSLDSVFVEADTLLPAFTLHTAALSCNQPTDTMRVTSLTAYDTLWWSGPAGFSGSTEAVVVSEVGRYRLHIVGENGCLAKDSLFVMGDFTAPVISTVGATLDCGENSVPISANATDTVVQWSWVGAGGFSANSNTIMVTSTGDYIVTATGLNGCEAIDTAVVQAGSGLPQFTAAGNTITCRNTSVSLSGSTTNGASLSWSGPNSFSSTENNPVVSSPGNYTLTASLGVNCSVDTTVMVVLDTLSPELSAQADTIDCAQTIANLQASTNSTSPIWSWSGPAGFSSSASTVDVNTAGIYEVQVEHPNGCSATLSLEVVADTMLPILQLSADTLSCINPIADLMADAPSAERFEWSGPNNFSSQAQDTTTELGGTYTLVATAANGCSVTDSLTVQGDTTPLVVAVEADTLSCNQPTVTINSSSNLQITYTWSGPNGFSTAQPNPIIDEAGSYELQAEAANGCRDTAVVQVEIDTLPPVLQLSADTLTCSTPAVPLAATAPDAQTFLWAGPDDFNAAMPTVPVVVPGWYTCTATAANGCRSQDSLEVVVDQTPPDLMVQGDTISCATPEVSLQSATTAEVLYNWSGPAGYSSAEAQPTVNTAGLYILTITAPNGCMATDTAMVVTDTLQPGLLLFADTLTCAQEQAQISVVSDAPVSVYNWSGPGGFSSSVAESLVVTPGTYGLTVTATNGCSQVAAVNVSVDTMPPQLTVITDTITCTQPNAQLTGSADGVGVAFSWSGPNGFTQTGHQATVGQGGTYTLMAIATNGCRQSLEVDIMADTLAPQLSVDDLRLDCRQAAAPLPATIVNNTAADLLWVGPDGFNATVLQPIVQSGGAYQVWATHPGNGCVDSAVLNVTIDTLAPLVDALATGQLDCQTDTVVLIGAGSAGGSALAFRWSTLAGAFGASLLLANTSATEAGLYVLTIENLDNGCTASDSVRVLENTTVPGVVELALSPSYCEGVAGSARIVSVQGGTPPYQYAIAGGPFTAVDSFPQLFPGTYELEVEDASGCRSTQTLIMPEPLPLTVGLPAEIEINFSDDYTFAPVLSFPEEIIAGISWSPADELSCSDCLRPTLQQPSADRTYTLAIATLEGCEALATVRVRVLKDRGVYLPNAFSPGNTDGRNDYFTVYAAGKEVVQVNRLAVFDRWGGQVFERRGFLPNAPSSGWDGSYRGKAAPTGLYIYWAEVAFVDGETLLLKGEVFLMR